MSRYENVRNFLFHEAHLLDERRFEEWLGLWHDSCLYWMPCRKEATTLHQHSALIEDTHSDLVMRVKRLAHPEAHTEAPTPNAVRVVSNVSILDDDGETIHARAKLVMHEFQRRAYTQHDDYRLFCATLHYKLQPQNGGYLIKEKRVDLVDGAGARTVMATPL
ncbi:MAG: aromatic-ring-hydroxylating dioxygenase subunit beta [Pseudomonadota bacterium]